MTIILASASESRRRMLDSAGVAHRSIPAQIDEAAVKAVMLARKVAPRNIADALAELKAVKISASAPGELVLGSDSIVVLADGTILDKPVDRDDAARHLRRLSATRHELISAAVMARDGVPIWRHVDIARLDVRPLSDAFIDAYLDAEWPAIAGCVGCYQLEGRGAQLFERIDGSHFTVLGMPLLAVLDYLRVQGELTS